MDYGTYLGFIAGMVAGILAVAFGLHVRTKRADPSDMMMVDERVSFINMRGGMWAFFIVTLTSFVVWVGDNVRLGQQGEAVEFFSPWGIMFFVCIVVYALARGYSHYLNSQSLLEGDYKYYRALGLTLALLGIGTGRAKELLPFFHYVSFIALIGGCALLALSLWMSRTGRGQTCS